MKRRGIEPTAVNDRIELELVSSGLICIVGCDEAGRGPLAGPVVASAVEFQECPVIWKCRDSKSLSPASREELFAEIIETLPYSVAAIDPQTIDRVNIRVASLMAMSYAVEKLPQAPDVILVDGRDHLPEFPMSRAIVKGDARVATISAASIIAKVSRDRLMHDYHAQYPMYGFNHHFGYPTAAHCAALQKHGPCPIHRRSFRGVRELVETD